MLRTRPLPALATTPSGRRGPFITNSRVIKTMRKSNPGEAFRMYHSSRLSFSSAVRSLAPFTCAQPVIPGLTISRTVGSMAHLGEEGDVGQSGTCRRSAHSTTEEAHQEESLGSNCPIHDIRWFSGTRLPHQSNGGRKFVNEEGALPAPKPPLPKKRRSAHVKYHKQSNAGK